MANLRPRLLASQTNGGLILHLPDGTNVTYTALPQQYDGNQIQFEPLNGLLVMPNETWNTEDKFVLVPDTTDSWSQEATLVAAMALNPKAILVYATSNMGNLMYSRSGKTTYEVTVPVLQLFMANWTDSIAPLLLANREFLNATITDQGQNVWKEYFDSWYLPVWSATTGAFCVVNIVLAVLILVRLGPLTRQFGTYCCYLEILSNGLRILWCVSPYAPWFMNTWPRTLQTVLLTTSIPSSLGTIVLLAFYWHQLISTHSISVSNWISTKAKIPVLVFVGLMAAYEIIASSLRANGVLESTKAVTTAITVNEAIYILFLVIMAVYYSYVTIRVFVFIRGLRKLKSSDKLLKRVSIRSSISIVGMVTTVIGCLMVVFPKFYFTPHGTNIAHYLIFLGLNGISCCQLLAFNPGTSASATTRTNGSNNSNNSNGKSGGSLPLASKSQSDHSSANQEPQIVDEESSSSPSEDDEEASSPGDAV